MMVEPTSTISPAWDEPVSAISAPIATGDNAPTMLPMPLNTPNAAGWRPYLRESAAERVHSLRARV